jgi:predicted HTH transcriptional regulator
MFTGFKKQYDTVTQALMLLHYSRLSEKERCHCTALEVVKLGYGSKSYICQLFNISQKTIEKGLLELQNPSLYAQIPEGKQRRVGGGRKKSLRILSSKD